MTSLLREFNDKVVEVEESISQAFTGIPADERLFTLRDLLLTQVRVCSLHYRLMQIGGDVRLMLSDAIFTKIMDRHLEFAKFFRSLPKSGASPSYEMESIIILYAFISHHFTNEKLEEDTSENS